MSTIFFSSITDDVQSNIKKKMWYDCQWDNCPQETKMTPTLTTIGHCTAFNNEHIQNSKVSKPSHQ